MPEMEYVTELSIAPDSLFEKMRRGKSSLDCYGCRGATDLAASKTVIGLPASMLPDVVPCLEFLGEKAIPTSRAKSAWAALKAKDKRGLGSK